ncbi:hypothetical protein DSUL_90046 [Desulfovibrionales bacterium]
MPSFLSYEKRQLEPVLCLQVLRTLSASMKIILLNIDNEVLHTLLQA